MSCTDGAARGVARGPADWTTTPSWSSARLRIGLTALQSVGVTLNVDAVRAEFERFADQSRAANERAAEALEGVLRANFADGDGRLPRTLESFLGDRGKLRVMVEELFDPSRRDSAIGRIALDARDVLRWRRVAPRAAA